MKKKLLILFLLSLFINNVKPEYDEQITKYCFQLCNIAYCLKNLIVEWDCGEEWDNLTWIQDVTVFEDLLLGSLSYVAYDIYKNKIVVVFRGS